MMIASSLQSAILLIATDVISSFAQWTGGSKGLAGGFMPALTSRAFASSLLIVSALVCEESA